ncbi:MAG: extracellular solute-binding protein [Defluviitaleaceae bacterium]|nr:extracellular solute-binding protein [Defluviitaleaceae bacterium]
MKDFGIKWKGCKFLAVAICIFAAVFLLTACGDSNGYGYDEYEYVYMYNEYGELVLMAVPPTTPPPPPPTTPTPTPAPPTIITFSGFERHNAVNLALVRAFNESQNSVYVQYIEFSPFEQAHLRLEAVIASGDRIFDVIDINALWAREMVRNNALMPLTSHLLHNPIELANLHPALLAAGEHNDAFWAIPRGFTVGVLAMRDDYVALAPSSLAALNNHAYAFRNEGWDFGYASSLGNFEETFRIMLEFIYGHGGRITDEYGNFNITNSGAVAGLEAMREAAQIGGIPENTAFFAGADAHEAFFAGNTPFLRSDSDIWAAGNFIGRVGDVRFAIAPMPHPTEAPIMDGYLLGISAASANPAQAWEFIQFVASEQGQIINARYGSQIPANTELMQNRLVRQNNPHFGLAQFQRLAENAQIGFQSPQFREILQIIQIEFAQFIQGEITAQQMTREIQRAVNIITP